MRTSEPVTIHRADYAPAPFRHPAIRLRVELSPRATRITCTLSLERVGPGELRLDGVELSLESLHIDGVAVEPAGYRLEPAALVLVDPPDRFELTTVAIIDPSANTALEGLYRSSGTFCTQCEAEGFRKITWALDRPDVLSVYDVEIVAADELARVLLSNGNRVGESVLDDGRRMVHWHDPHPKPSYLFALVAGHLSEIGDRFVTASGREVALSIFVEAHNADRCDFAMASLKHAMAWDERVYGLEYDLERFMIVAVDDFNMGAMENKGLNVFNSKFVLADTDTATDTDFLWIEAVIAHEYFHNWTGNRITCRDWFQLSLKEGLTVYRDQQFTADRHSATVKRIEDVQRLRAQQFPEDAGPLAHPIRPDSYIEINNFYTPTVYEKGAEVIRMLATLIGPDAYFAGIRRYVASHDGEAATCEDFVVAMERANDIDLSRFRRWYAYAGTPTVRATERWDEKAGRITLTLHQHCPDTPGQSDKAPMHLPIAIGLLDRNGQDLLHDENGHAGRVLSLSEREQRFDFTVPGQRPTVSWLRGFSAPVRLEVDQDVTTLGFLAAHDSDGFNRWEAGQRLAHIAIGARLDGQEALGDEAAAALVAMAGAALHEGCKDPALAAETLRLPGTMVIGEERAVIDVPAIEEARQALTATIARAHQGALLALVSAATDERDTAFGGAASGVRALRGAAVALLCTLDESVWVEPVERLYANAATMTDRVAALAALCHASDAARPGSARQRALADFRERFDGNALVIDKWFTLQAMSRREDTFEQVLALSRRDDFDTGNPNRLRALVSGFSGANPGRFHDPAGHGYRFVADQVIAMDPLNPRIGARLVAPLVRWRRHTEPAATLMRAELLRIRESASVTSPDVIEQIDRSLPPA